MRASGAEQVLSLKIYYPSFAAAELAQAALTGHSFDTTTTTWHLTAVRPRPGHGRRFVIPRHHVSRIVSDIGRALQSAASARYPAAVTLVCRPGEISHCPCTLYLKIYCTDDTFSSFIVYVCVCVCGYFDWEALIFFLCGIWNYSVPWDHKGFNPVQIYNWKERFSVSIGTW